MRSIIDFFTSIFSRPEQPILVADEPTDEPYRAYTTEFDLEVDAIELAKVIPGSSPDKSKGWLELGDYNWSVAVKSAKNIYESLVSEENGDVTALLDPMRELNLNSSCVSILIDQSGSMKGEPIARAAAISRLLMDVLDSAGAKTELLGFSTCGWHGGFARKLWLTKGRPPRPGRLCALMHIVYKSSDQPTLDERRWQAMLNPDILRENIDGEAILWATSRLKRRTEKHKVLILISDGAPVDDSTLAENGPSYLERHLLGAVKSIEDECEITLAAIGIGYKVDCYYPLSVSVKNASDMPTALASLLKNTLKL